MIWDIIEIEGGYVNHPDDKGGPTKYGITQQTYTEYLGRSVSIEEIKNLDKEIAYQIYYKKYYLKPEINMLYNEFLQHLILDMSINHGPSTAIRLLQKTINETDLHDLATDGILGPNTTKAANNCYSLMARYFTNQICHTREKFYLHIVKNNPSQRVFLKGWLKRCDSFLTEVPYNGNVFYPKLHY